mmetsp:Transcript_16812/g.23799  ORF Transcript_16812/g.23799 Transcript_16812/m.23799 type:complete len:408 (+) Transcript_16812:1193-2416(+)
MLNTFYNPIQNSSSISTLTTQLDPMSFVSKSSEKSIPSQHPNLTPHQMQEGSHLGIDTHADTSVAGSHVCILEFINGATYNVSPFHGSPVKNISLSNVIIAVDREDGQEGYILELNSFLNFTASMNHSLLCPIQARLNGVKINNAPKNLSPTSSQSIIINNQISIPIYFHGPIPYIHIRYPTDQDMDMYKWIPFTQNSIWCPHQIDVNVSQLHHSPTTTTYALVTFCDIDSFCSSIEGGVIISSVNVSTKLSSLTPESLSKMWRIPLILAKRTMEVTTWSSICTNEGKMSRCFCTDLYQQRYHRLGGPDARFYTDTHFSKVKSIFGYTCAQLYNNSGGSKVYTMVAEHKAHKSLITFVHQVSIPQELHTNGAKALTQGEFQKKTRKYKKRPNHIPHGRIMLKGGTRW